MALVCILLIILYIITNKIQEHKQIAVLMPLIRKLFLSNPMLTIKLISQTSCKDVLTYDLSSNSF